MRKMIDSDGLVLRLVQKASPGGVEGKKALQKMLYFLSRRQGDIYFRWEHYGPFSPVIHGATAYLIDTGKIQVEHVPTGKEGAVISRMTYPAPAGGDHKDAGPVKIPDELERELDSVLEFAGQIDRKRQPRELELLASVHFLASFYLESDGRYDVARVNDHLNALKPRAGFKLEDVERAIKILEDASYL